MTKELMIKKTDLHINNSSLHPLGLEPMFDIVFDMVFL